MRIGEADNITAYENKSQRHKLTKIVSPDIRKYVLLMGCHIPLGS